MLSTNISIRQVEQKDFKQVADLYYRYLLGDFVGYCGRRMFNNYLKSLCNSRQGSLWCAVAEEGEIIGFVAGIIDQQRFNRNWLRRNLIQITIFIMMKLLFSTSFRSFIYKRLRNRLKKAGSVGESKETNKSISLAYLKWIAVDEDYRGRGKNVGSQLLASIERDVKRKGVTQIYSFTNRTNNASIFMHLKNGWQVEENDSNSFKLFKNFVIDGRKVQNDKS